MLPTKPGTETEYCTCLCIFCTVILESNFFLFHSSIDKITDSSAIIITVSCSAIGDPSKCNIPVTIQYCIKRSAINVKSHCTLIYCSKHAKQKQKSRPIRGRYCPITYLAKPNFSRSWAGLLSPHPNQQAGRDTPTGLSVTGARKPR